MDCLAWLIKEYNHCRLVYRKYENRNYNYYDSDSRPGQQLHSQFSPGDLAVVEGQRSAW